MKQDDLINTLFHSRDPLEGLDKVQSYYDRYYDYNIIVIDRNEANKYLERIPYHLGDLVVGYVINKVTNHLIPVLGRVSMLTHCELQAIFRVHHIDQGLMEGLLFQLNEEAGKPSFLENLPI